MHKVVAKRGGAVRIWHKEDMNSPKHREFFAEAERIFDAIYKHKKRLLGKQSHATLWESDKL